MDSYEIVKEAGSGDLETVVKMAHTVILDIGKEEGRFLTDQMAEYVRDMAAHISKLPPKYLYRAGGV
jgi:hypothetical protein